MTSSQTPLPGREPAAGDHTEAAEHGSVGAAGPTTPAGQGTHQVRGAANTTEKAQFVDTLDAEIAESMKDPEYSAAWRRIEVREATYGLDKRQARRVRRRMGTRSGSEVDHG